ncbi:5358_t:CDS:2 [Ambispora gerdemannii]|uniref:5358_t:CDS:1 n=1 Tax=Ambispora gerdemannii TaxID=144530 RepID=A0A9N9GBP2_9GLOM|nr:5358_t:CDS:2 [Ambispora gerdemannii]
MTDISPTISVRWKKEPPHVKEHYECLAKTAKIIHSSASSMYSSTSSPTLPNSYFDIILPQQPETLAKQNCPNQNLADINCPEQNLADINCPGQNFALQATTQNCPEQNLIAIRDYSDLLFFSYEDLLFPSNISM